MPHHVRWRAAVAGPWLVAATVPPAVFLLSLWLTDKAPLGGTGRSINDLGFQFEPMHAYLRDLLHGQVTGGWQLNWSSGLGVPFVPDYATYLASPFALLLAATPRAAVPTGLVLITALKYSAASLAMLAYLRRRRPDGPLLVAALLSSAYALCGWAVDDASYVTMWLDGLIGLPLIALVGQWAIERRHAVLAPLLVGLVWWANFYTAWMATLGAGALTLATVLAAGGPAREQLLALLRAARHVLLGVLLTAVTLLPTLLAIRRAQPAGDSVPRPWSLADSLSRLLPQTEGVGATPGLYVGTITLVCALCLPLLRSVPPRERWVQALVLVGVTGSLFWGPTMALWHGFDTPQGSPFRQAFVVCGLVVVSAWLAVTGIRAMRPPWALLVGVALVGVLVLGTTGSPWRGASSGGWAVATLGVVAVWLLSSRVMPRWRRRVARVTVLTLAVLLVAELLVTAVHVSRARDPRFAPVPAAWGPRDDGLLDRVAAAAGGSEGRTSFPDVMNPNAAMLYGAEGAGYYSSVIPAVTAGLLAHLGHRVEGYGRRVFDTSDPVALSLEGVSRVLGQSGDQIAASSFPFVRVLPEDASPEAVARATDPSAFQAALVGAGVITAPTTTVDRGTGPVPFPPDGLVDEAADGRAVIAASCPRGTVARLWAPDQGGVVDVGLGPVPLLPRSQHGSSPPYARNGLITLRSTDDGPARAVITPAGGLSLPATPISCVDLGVLERAINSARATAPTRIALGRDGFTARWATAASGTALVATSALDGWNCSADGTPLKAVDVGGMLGLGVSGASEIECRYRTPGLGQGLLLSLLGLGLIPATAPGLARRPRRGAQRAS